MDFLSFLTQVIGYLVGFANTIAGLVAIAFIFMLIRCLPSRMRAFVSACATVVITFALFKTSVENFGLFVVKTAIIHLAIAGIVTITVLRVLMAIVAFFPRRFVQGQTVAIPIEIRQRRLASSRRSIIASNAFLQTSPIIIQ